MSDTMPATPSGVIAYLTVKNGTAALDFYTRAFGAALQYKKMADDGKRLMHARMLVNGGVLMLSDDFPEYNGGVSMAPDADRPRGVTLHMQVPDCDAAFSQAVAAGAAGIMAPADMFWGDRYARIRDPFGHIWSLGHTVGK
jgi:PhnB protein